MGELCPDGWLARLKLRSAGAAALSNDPPGRPSVELDWEQFDRASGLLTTTRHVSAPTIGGAMQAMIEDRRMDLRLEQIERAAGERGNEAWGA